MNTAHFEFDLHFHTALEALRRGDVGAARLGLRFAMGAANRSGCKRRRSAACRVSSWLRAA
jgi:hypothetical protein